MANPLRNLLQKKAVAELSARTCWVLTGIAHDFWKDGPENPFLRFRARPSIGVAKPSPPPPAVPPRPVRTTSPAVPSAWRAMPGEISEKMWGEGFVAPGGGAMLDMLLKPLGLDKQTNVLDLSAGLGAFLHKATADFGAYVTSLESDPAIAIRANELLIESGKGKVDAITYYTPDAFVPAKTVSKVYDCIIARDVFYRVRDKHKFFTALAACTKPQAQISFTDYIVNPEDKNKPAIVAWTAYEGNVAPLGLVAMAEAWAKVGFKLRVHDDQTHFYRQEVLGGLQRLAQFLATGIRPDAETRQDILRRMDLWTHRLTAMEQGMKFYRFYGTK